MRECILFDYDYCPLNLLGAHFPTLPASFRKKVFQQLDDAMAHDPSLNLRNDFTFFSFVNPDSPSYRQLTEPWENLVRAQSNRKEVIKCERTAM
jgi:hypothetical protein